MRHFVITALTAAAVGTAACNSSSTSPMAPTPAPAVPTIAGIAANNPSFSTLVSALSKAGLVGTFDGTQRFTVFAPTNDAFDAAARAFGFADGPALVSALDVGSLTAILTYHVTAGDQSAATVISTGAVHMLDGNVATVANVNGAARIENATIVSTDIQASNGLIHVIDAVLVPPALR